METKMKRGRLLYIIEAAVEYLISILVVGQFLTTLTNELGLSDSLTGILSSIISLGCMFQLISMAFRRTTVKRFVVVMSILNQLFFLFLYVVPIVPLPSTAKIVLFVVFILTAYLIYNIAHPKKIAWLMGLVPDSRRGKFTAVKEIVSLIVGSTFSFSMGMVFDHFTEKGETRTALIIGAITIFVLMVWHTLTLLLTVEKKPEESDENALAAPKRVPLKESFLSLIKNKKMRKVIALFMFYNIAHYAVNPFLYTFQRNDLEFSQTLVALLGVLGSVARIAVSWLWGLYADRTSFAAMMEKCIIIMGVAYLFVAAVTPYSHPIVSIVLVALYYIFHSIAMGGTNSALINLVFDYVPHETRADSLAICQAIAGVVGFLSTLGFSAVLAVIQGNGLSIFGFQIYAQQLLAVVAILLFVATALYIRFALLKKNKKQLIETTNTKE